MKICLNTVFYNPSLNDIESFLLLSKIFDNAQCYLNSEIDSYIFKLLKRNNVNVIGNKKNDGLSKAYNSLFKALINNDFQYNFLIDQDSRFKNYIVKDFLANALMQFNKKNKTGIISMFPINRLIESEIKGIYLKTNYKFEFMDYVINSGSLISSKAWLDIGGYDEELFIDKVDYNFCRILKNKNWQILRSNKHIFSHSLGQEKKYFFGLIKYNSYNSIRHFHIMKSRIYVFQKTNHINNKNKNFYKYTILLLQLIKHFLLVILFEDNKVRKIKSLIKAINASINLK